MVCGFIFLDFSLVCGEDRNLFISALNNRKDHFKSPVRLYEVRSMRRYDDALSRLEQIGYFIDNDLRLAFDDLGKSVEGRGLFRQSFPAVEGHDTDVAR